MRFRLLAGSFLLSAIPVTLIVAQTRGVNIRMVGSGNPGACNIMLHVGRFWGWLVAAFDFFKGVVPVVIAQSIRLDVW